MEVTKFVSKEGLKWRCKEHPNVPCEFICLDGDAKNRLICFWCLQANPIPLQNLISMSCILASNENEILQAYPPLNDQTLHQNIRNVAQHEQPLEEIDAYFQNLLEDFEKQVRAAQNVTKELLIKQQKAKQDLLDGYMKIAEIEKLKELIVSEKEGAAKDLDQFIKEKWTKAAENKRILLDLLNSEAEYQYSSDEPNRIAQKISEGLKSISFFMIQSIEQVNIIKSTFGSSQNVEISKVDNFSCLLIQKACSGQSSQVFLDPILDPLKKYILHIELELRARNSNNQFAFGLVKDEGKDRNFGYQQNMCYHDYSNSYGVTKQIKGDPMQFGDKAKGKHSFEVRIHLNQGLLRVASLPDYSSIAELDNPQKIDPKVNYRFFLSMYNQGDMIKINKFTVVSLFDRKM